MQTTVERYGKSQEVILHSRRCLRHETFGARPVQAVIIQDTTNTRELELAII